MRTGWPARHPSPKKSPGPSIATTASLPVLRQHRQLDAATLECRDVLAAVALREHGLAAPDAGGASSRPPAESRNAWALNAGNGRRAAGGGASTFHPRDQPAKLQRPRPRSSIGEPRDRHAACCSAQRTTLVGSMMPAWTRSLYWPVCGVEAGVVPCIVADLHRRRRAPSSPGVRGDPAHRAPAPRGGRCRRPIALGRRCNRQLSPAPPDACSRATPPPRDDAPRPPPWSRASRPRRAPSSLSSRSRSRRRPG